MKEMGSKIDFSFSCTGEQIEAQAQLLSSQNAIDEYQDFMIVEVSRNRNNEGSNTTFTDTIPLTGLGEECDIKGSIFKPIASITAKGGGQYEGGHFTFECRRGETGDWYEIDDSHKPLPITTPLNGFLYLFMRDAPLQYF